MSVVTFLQEILEKNPALPVKRDEALNKHSSFKIGGNANLFVSVETLDTLTDLVRTAWRHSVPVQVIGGGTNILVGDEGFDGLIIKNNCRRFELQGMKGKYSNNQLTLSQAYLYAESGAIINQVVRFVLDQGFGGIEFALGLPGTVGGAVAVNANYPKEDIRIGRSVYAAKILTRDGIIDVDNSYFHYGFDDSAILRKKEVVLSVLFALYPEEKRKLWERAEQAVTYRTTTQPKMLLSGMTFRNMTMKILYPNSSLQRDVSVQFLLEKAGLLGYRIGDVEVWHENPGYILNHGKATREDVEKVLVHLREVLFRSFGVQLEVRLHALS